MGPWQPHGLRLSSQLPIFYSTNIRIVFSRSETLTSPVGLFKNPESCQYPQRHYSDADTWLSAFVASAYNWAVCRTVNVMIVKSTHLYNPTDGFDSQINYQGTQTESLNDQVYWNSSVMNKIDWLKRQTIYLHTMTANQNFKQPER